MSRPVVSTATEALYAQLPQYQRDADPTFDFPLLRYVSLLGDQAEATRAYLADPGQLVDPYRAPYSILPWLAMMAGVDYTLYPDTDGLRSDLRDAIAGVAGSRRPGSDAAILNAVQPLLTGSRIAFIDAKNPTGFTFRVNVYDAQAGEQADLQRVLDAVTPAGLKATLNVIPGQTWGDIEDAGSTWGDFEDAGLTWDDIGSAIPDDAGRRTWAQVGDRTWAQVEGSTWDQFSRQ